VTDAVPEAPRRTTIHILAPSSDERRNEPMSKEQA